MKLYHVTLLDNLENILKEGLIPQIGEKSEEIGETEKRIYLFPSLVDMETALMSWLGEWYENEYGENVKLVSLEINLPSNFELESEVEYEMTSKNKIPNTYIKFLKEE